MGLKLPKDISPFFFCIGKTTAAFHKVGTDDSLRLLLNIEESGLLKYTLNFLSSREAKNRGDVNQSVGLFKYMASEM